MDYHRTRALELESSASRRPDRFLRGREGTLDEVTVVNPLDEVATAIEELQKKHVDAMSASCIWDLMKRTM